VRQTEELQDEEVRGGSSLSIRIKGEKSPSRLGGYRYAEISKRGKARSAKGEVKGRHLLKAVGRKNSSSQGLTSFEQSEIRSTLGRCGGEVDVAKLRERVRKKQFRAQYRRGRGGEKCLGLRTGGPHKDAKGKKAPNGALGEKKRGDIRAGGGVETSKRHNGRQREPRDDRSRERKTVVGDREPSGVAKVVS